MNFHKNRLFFTICLIFFDVGISFSQQSQANMFSIEATVYGYHYDSSKKLLKKEKQVELEGTLKGVDATAFIDNDAIIKTKSNSFGELSFQLKIGSVYRLELTRIGYTKSILIIDLTEIPDEICKMGIKFKGLELILNSYLIKDTSITNLPYAKLFYNSRKKQIDYEANKISAKKGLFGIKKDEELSTPLDLLKKSVIKNQDNLKSIKVEEPKQIIKRNKKKSIYVPPDTNFLEPALPKKIYKPKRYIIDAKVDYQTLSAGELEEKRRELFTAKKQLEIDKLNASSADDSIAIENAEMIINARTSELRSALKLIQLQEQEISTQRKVIYLIIVSSFLLLSFLGIVYKFYRDKRKTNILLNENNKKITDSINYAKRIQDSILLNEKEVENLLPNSFVYFQPRDIVSGDFYWFSEHNNKILVAAVDCTGHGVPGAFLSLIGNALLNEIIYEKKILDPAEILKLLNKGVLKQLNQNVEEGKSLDGMELSICLIDKEAKEITFAGAMNPVFVVKKDIVKVIEPDIKSIGGINNFFNKEEETSFKNNKIEIEEGMAIYLFSDGYMDQFGGEQNKKFNTSNFKKLLIGIQNLNSKNQKIAIEKAFFDWKGSARQIDDILVIGVKF